jgi:serine/threonine-protein kinase
MHDSADIVSFSTTTEVSLVPLTEPAESTQGAPADDNTPHVPDVGDVVGGTYRIESRIGTGAMGVVLRAFDERLGRSVALKVIRPTLASPAFRELFQKEARAMALVSHPNVVVIHSFGEHVGVPYFVMELVHGSSLDTILHAQKPLALPFALGLLDQACRGLSAIHEAGTVHRDVKPANLLVDRDSRLHIGDLGLAAPYGQDTKLGQVVGTPGYMAPEILSGQGEATPASDLYSLGCVAYEVLVGKPPFSRASHIQQTAQHLIQPPPQPSSERSDLPASFDPVLLRALAKKPQDRFESVDAFRRALVDATRRALDPTRILVVEDDQDQRELLELALRAEFDGTDIECVADGAAALEAFVRCPATVVVSDLCMPDMDGKDLTRMLRSRSDAQTVPIIVLTASGGPEEWRQLSAMGADRFVLKPVNIGDLVSTIRRAIRERDVVPEPDVLLER